MQEEWREAVGYPGYFVSSLGRVASRRRVLKVYSGSRGRGDKRPSYLSAAMSVGGVVYRRRVHHLVLEAFVGPRPSAFHEAAHWDGDRFNNCASNLRWATKHENIADEVRLGRMPAKVLLRLDLTRQ